MTDRQMVVACIAGLAVATFVLGFAAGWVWAALGQAGRALRSNRARFQEAFGATRNEIERGGR